MDEDEEQMEKIGSNGWRAILHQMIKPRSISDSPTKLSSALVTWSVTTYTIVALIFSLIVSFVDASKWYTIVLLVIFGLILVGILFIIARQPRSSKELAFTVPFVPWLPALSILVNVYLMTQLDYMTWVRFLVWIVVGLLIYFCYGIFHSQLRYRKLPEHTMDARAISSSTETIVTSAAGVHHRRDKSSDVAE